MRLLIASHTAELGGAERAMLELVEGISHYEPQWDIRVVAPDEGPLLERLRSAGATCAVRPTPWWIRERAVRKRDRLRFCASAVHRTLHALAEIRRSRADVVVSNTLASPVWALASRFAGRPHVWFVHEFGDMDHGYHFTLGADRSRRAICTLSATVVVNSNALQSVFAGVSPAADVVVIRYAVDTPDVDATARTSREGHPFRFCLLGQVRPSKGQADAVHALSILKERGISAELQIIGPSVQGYAEVVAGIAAQVDVAPLVSISGPVGGAAQAFADADAALMCSTREAFGRVTVEAMKLGLPVIAAAAGGSVEIIEDEVTGLLYEPGSVTALADCMQRLIEDAGLRRRLAHDAREHAQRVYDREKYSLAFIDVVRGARHGGVPRRALPPDA